MDSWIQEIELMAVKKAAFDASPDPWWIKKFDQETGLFVMVFINQAYTRYTGIKYSDYVGKTDYDVHPKSAADEYHKNDMEVYISGSPIWDYEHLGEFQYPMSKAPYILANKKIGIIGSMKINEKFKK